MATAGPGGSPAGNTGGRFEPVAGTADTIESAKAAAREMIDAHRGPHRRPRAITESLTTRATGR